MPSKGVDMIEARRKAALVKMGKGVERAGQSTRAVGMSLLSGGKTLKKFPENDLSTSHYTGEDLEKLGLLMTERKKLVKKIRRVTTLMRQKMLKNASINGNWYKLFKSYDRDNSGNISFAELAYVVYKELDISKLEMSLKELRSVWGVVDINGDNTVIVEEFALVHAAHGGQQDRSRHPGNCGQATRRGPGQTAAAVAHEICAGRRLGPDAGHVPSDRPDRAAPRGARAERGAPGRLDVVAPVPADRRLLVHLADAILLHGQSPGKERHHREHGARLEYNLKARQLQRIKFGEVLSTAARATRSWSTSGTLIDYTRSTVPLYEPSAGGRRDVAPRHGADRRLRPGRPLEPRLAMCRRRRCSRSRRRPADLKPPHVKYR